MELARPVYDKKGNMLVAAHVELTEKHIEFLWAKEVYELLIDDLRVPDLTIKPLVSIEIQQEAVQAMRRLLTIDRSTTTSKDINDPEIYAARLELDRLGHAIRKAILTASVGEPDLTGSLSVSEYEFLMPVQATQLAILLAKESGMEEDALVNVARAVMLQNIGYIWIPPGIRRDTSDVSDEERRLFEQHPIHGYEALVQAERIPQSVAIAVLQHHERWNGSGYPHGLRGWDISPIAQMMAIAETYYEMVSARPHRRPHSSTDAFEHVMASAGELFDPELVQIFARRVPLYPCGVMVKLNTGETGIITNSNIGHVGRPVVRICYDTLGNEVYPPYEMDLASSEHAFKMIAEILDL